MLETDSLSSDQLARLHPADIADYVQRLPVEEAIEQLRGLPVEVAARALAEVADDNLEPLLEAIPSQRLALLLAELPPESAVDLLQRLAPPQRRETLGALEADVAARVRALLRYPEDSAGGIMSNRFIVLREDMTVGEVREILRACIPDENVEDVADLYVTDDQQRLVGTVDLRDIAFRRDERRLADIMHRTVRALLVTDDQEKIAQQFAHYHHLSLPVTDETGRLLGVVNASDALAIAAREATEDMQLMVGLTGEERALTPWTLAVRRRLPWLCINVGTAFLAALVIGLHEHTIAQWTALAAFLPIVAGQGGNAGMQTLTVIIRDLALGELSPGDGRRALLKELLLGLVHGVVIGTLVGTIGYLWKGSLMLGVIVSLAMVLNLLVAAAAGVLIPLGLKACRLDPAMASSIFLTTITDIAGFLFFLGLATLVLARIS